MEKKSQNVHIKRLSELKTAIVQGDVDKLKTLNNSIEFKGDLKKCLSIETNPFRCTNAVILACKEKQVKILQYLFSKESKLIENSSASIQPADADETHHNAFYYAIRSVDSELVQMLIRRHFGVHVPELDEIISRAYEELKINNVSLSNEVKFFIEQQLIDMRFDAANSQRSDSVEDFIITVKKRVALVVESAKFVIEKYSTTAEIDEECLYTLKFVAQNINVLKQKLKSTYDRLPWEEIEFGLAIFISTYCTKQEINLYWNACLEDRKILSHLESFLIRLGSEIENLSASRIGDLTAPIKQKRSVIVESIISSCPEFESLYEMYHRIRDIHSLEKISETLKLGLGADVNEREGKILISRMLQVLGEYMKNTLESPKLSDGTNELLLASLPKSTRKLVLRLRDSMSHIDSLFKRTEIENNKEHAFFNGILADLKGIGSVVDDMLQAKKNSIFSELINKICEAETFDKYCKVMNTFRDNYSTDFWENSNFDELVNNRIIELVEELSRIVTDQTDYEKQLFQQLNIECRSVQEVLFSIARKRAILKSILCSHEAEITEENFRDFGASKFWKLDSETKLAAKYPDFKKIGILIVDIYQSVKGRSVQAYVNDFERTMWHVMGMIASPDVKWIQDLEYKLNEKGLPPRTSRSTNIFTRENYRKELSKKKSELECILNKGHTSNQSFFKSFELYKSDKKLQAVVEMLVLDIMSIAAALKMDIGRDFLFVDDVCPVLVGKCLRNHLAHNNELVTLLLDDPDRVIFLNAIKLIAEDLDGNGKKQRRVPVAESISDLKKRYDNCRGILSVKRVMFAACEKGCIDELKTNIRNGADVNSRCRKGHGVLHFASKGGSTELLEFLLDLDRNLSLSTHELEVSVSYGRRQTVEFIVQRLGMPSVDTKEEKLSLLHIAAKNGHKDIVEYLIENKSDPKKYNRQGLPIHYAAQWNHKNVVEFLLKSGGNSIDDRNVGGFSLLHIAVDLGYVELVEYLLELGADVNAKTDGDYSTPLHLAANRGNLEVVKMLVSKGANVNSRVLDGFSSIYFASRNNYVNVVSFLSENGANVNTADKLCKNTSLHIACEKGYKNIVEVLLDKGADVNPCNIEGVTPMYLAVASGDSDILSILLAHGADVHIKTNNHDTLLHYAARSGQTQIADRLIGNKLEINAINMENVTPIFAAAYNGHVDVVDLLLKNGASVDLQDKEGCTPLHVAVTNNQKNVVEILMKSGAQLDVMNNSGQSPLCIAIVEDHNDVMSLLIEHRAEITDIEFKVAIVKGNIYMVKRMFSKLNIKHKSLCWDALFLAVESERTEIVKFLISHGVHLNICGDDRNLLKHAVSKNNKEVLQLLVDNGLVNGNGESINQALFEAVKFGHADIVDILLKKCDSVDKCFNEGKPLLLQAAQWGYNKIFNSVIRKCKNLDVASQGGTTALHVAALLGRKEIVEILLDKGANVNAVCDDGTALHLAAAQNDNPEIVELLLNKGADMTIEDKKQRTALQLAVANNKLEIVKTFLSGSGKKYINYTGTADGLTLLHIAAQRQNMDMVKYLLDQGADIDLKNMNGSKAIHHAVREGSIEIVKYLVSKGSSLNETGFDKRTLLHYATMKGQIELVEYLIAENANVNAQTKSGLTPLHICALSGFKDVARVLLNNGAMYNVVDRRNNKPEDMVGEQHFYMSEEFFKENISNGIKEQNETVALLRSTDNLLKAVKRNDISAVRKCIEEGAVLNAKDIRDNMALHYAAWKGYAPIAEVLLSAKANANAPVKDGSTPLHYSAKFSHVDVAKILLSHGARYNSINDSKSTPLNLATDTTIKDLLKVIDDVFKYVGKGSEQVLNEIEKLKDSDTLKAVMNARNENNKTLLMVAKLCDFPKLKELTKILISERSSYLDMAELLIAQEKYKEALEVYQNEMELMKLKLGPDNFAILDLKNKIARLLYKQSKYDEALRILTEVYDLQKEHLGSDNKDAMSTRSTIALFLHRQGKNNEALDIYYEIYHKQKKYMKLTNDEMCNTQLHMALVLDHLLRHEEALKLNTEIYETFRKAKGENNQTTLTAKNNIAMNLSNMGQHDKAIEKFEEVFKRRTHVLGPSHSDTLRCLHNIASVYLAMARYEEAVTRLEQVLEIQRKAFGFKHRDTINTQFNLGRALFRQGKTIVALKTLKEYLRNAESILGLKHLDILMAQAMITSIDSLFHVNGSMDAVAHLDDLQKKLNIAAGEGAEQTVIDMINNNVDVNYVDEDGRSALYYAVYSGNVRIIKILLENSANVFQVTNKGNTLFHAAASKGYAEIVEVLLDDAERKEHMKVIELINTRTTTGGSTPLHVASKNGSYEIVKSLLKRGAAFDVGNNEGLMPSEVSQHQDVNRLFEYVQNIFMYALNGNAKRIITHLKKGHSDHVKAAIRARNFQSLTLLQAVLFNCERNIAVHIVDMLKDEELGTKSRSQ